MTQQEIIDQADKDFNEAVADFVEPIMRPVKTQYNASAFPTYGERNSQPSLTVPDQSMSLKTLLERYARGLPISGNNSEPVYYGEEEMPNVNKMDISEIHDLKNAVAADIKSKQADLQKQQQDAQKAAHEKHINDEVDKRVKDKSKKDDKPDPQKS